MRAILVPDLATFADRVLPFLLADPVRNNVASTIVQDRLAGMVPTEPDAVWLSVHDTNGDLVGVAMMTPPSGLLLNDMPPVAIDALVARLAIDGLRLSNVNGPVAPCARFARDYADATGTTAYPGGSSRMFRLDSVEPPHGVPGNLREATAADRDLLVE